MRPVRQLSAANALSGALSDALTQPEPHADVRGQHTRSATIAGSSLSPRPPTRRDAPPPRIQPPFALVLLRLAVRPVPAPFTARCQIHHAPPPPRRPRPRVSGLLSIFVRICHASAPPELLPVRPSRPPSERAHTSHVTNRSHAVRIRHRSRSREPGGGFVSIGPEVRQYGPTETFDPPPGPRARGRHAFPQLLQLPGQASSFERGVPPPALLRSLPLYLRWILRGRLAGSRVRSLAAKPDFGCTTRHTYPHTYAHTASGSVCSPWRRDAVGLLCRRPSVVGALGM
ncbi:hypothetical protein C8Q78DRAFT_469718 [Trametes maxima]|nr:hypothetical protein C8Q78DRAFT_469718 [Trametes maxima]